MGEYAEMVLEGLLDEETGEYIGDINKKKYGVEAPGFPVSYERESREKNKPTHEPLSKKNRRRLEIIRDRTDNHHGMYPGEYFDSAPSTHNKLIARGYAELYHPNNPIHSVRVVITDYGREALEKAK